jgi:hypothetical protein
MAEETLHARYKKYLQKYPLATYDEFLVKIRSVKTIGTPNVRYMPDGIVVPVKNFFPSEISEIGREVIQSSYQQQ